MLHVQRYEEAILWCEEGTQYFSMPERVLCWWMFWATFPNYKEAQP